MTPRITPGEWTTRPCDNNVEWEVVAPDGCVVAMTFGGAGPDGHEENARDNAEFIVAMHRQACSPPKIAPVQGFSPGIPWAMHLRAYDAYCKRYGPQPALIDLEGRGCRGGFHANELDEFIPGWRDELSELKRLQTENAALRSEVDRLQRRAAGLFDVHHHVWDVPT